MKNWILITDAAKARIFSTRGRGAPLELVHELTNPRGRWRIQEIVSDEPGRLRKGTGRNVLSAMDPKTSPQEVEKQRFARVLTGVLQDGRDRRDYDALAIVAPPHFLGLLRGMLGTRVRACLRASIARNCTRVSARELPDRLLKSFDAAGAARAI